MLQIPFVPDPYDVLYDGLKWLLRQWTEGIVTVLDMLFRLGFERFLFFVNPGHREFLQDIWWTSLTVYLLIAGISTVAMLLLAQFFPGKDAADLQVHMERVARSFVIVLLSRPFIEFFVAFTNYLAGVFYTEPLPTDTIAGMMFALTEEGNVFMAAVLSSSVGLWFAIFGILFFAVLVVRMLLVYIVYAMFPVFMAFKLMPVGPGTYLKTFGEKFVNAAGLMLVLGILIAAVFTVSTAVADFGDYEEDVEGSISTSGGTYLGPSLDGQFSDHGLVNITIDILRMMMPMVVVIYMCITLLMNVA